MNGHLSMTNRRLVARTDIERLMRDALSRVKTGLCLTGTPAQRAKCRLKHIIARDRILANGGQWHDVGKWNFAGDHMRRTLRWEWVR